MLYVMARFVHVVGAVGMFVVLGLEWASHAQLRRARTVEQVREWAQLSRMTRWLGPASMLALLVPGFYMTGTAWKGSAPWINLGFGSLVVIGVIGAVAGRPMGKAVRAALAEQGTLSPGILAGLRAPLPWISLQVRAALLLGIVYLMTSKVALRESMGALGVALVIAMVSCVLSLRARPQTT